MTTIQPDTTYRLSIAGVYELNRNGNAIRLASISGIVTRHDLWWLTPAERFVYLVAPEGGPAGFGEQSRGQVRVMPAWTIPAEALEYEGGQALMELQLGAIHYVTGVALDEVAAEYDLPVPEWRGAEAAEEPDGAPCCSDPGCGGNPCTFPGYAANH